MQSVLRFLSSKWGRFIRVVAGSGLIVFGLFFSGSVAGYILAVFGLVMFASASGNACVFAPLARLFSKSTH